VILLLAACILSSVVEESWTELHRVRRSDEMCQIRSDFIGQLQGLEKSFLKSQPTVLGVFIGFWASLGFSYYLNEQLGSLLVDLTHQLNFYLYSPVL